MASTETLPEWRITRDGTTVVDGVFDVAPLVETANPFGDYLVFKADDNGGAEFDNLARGTRIDAAVSTNGGITFQNKFTGYVVERRETEQSGADVLEVEAYSFDQFLRRATVSNDQQGKTITDALQDIVTTDTPVDFVSANVTVTDEQELTRSYRGEPVEQVLRDLAFKSGNEAFGVNDQLEFFFRPRETRHIDRGIDETQWINYDIPELGKETVNEVEVWFSDGNESVVVDDGADKLDLQDSLGLSDPGTQRAELQRPLITDISDAEDIGRKYLKFRTATLSGTITTFGLFDADPGDTIDVTIPSRGIDTEFTIAAVRYRWGRDETELTIVERRGDVDDILTELSESVKRQELSGADRDAPKNRITTTEATAKLAVETTPSTDAQKVVNDGRRAFRDAWTGGGIPDITTLVVGDDNTGLSRSNSSLANQTDSASVTQTLVNDTTVEFAASVTASDVSELGLETAAGTLVARATFDTPVDLNQTVTVTLSARNDPSISRGLLTGEGLTAVRDVIADNGPDLPAAYAYGSDDTEATESDTTLGNKVVETDLGEVTITDVDTETEWRNLVDGGAGTTETDATQPVYVTTGGELQHAQSLWVFEGENNILSGTRSDGEYSGGQATFISGQFSSTGDSASMSFTTNYTIPEANVDVRFRLEPVDDTGDGLSETPEFAVRIDGNTVFQNQFTTSNLDLAWEDLPGFSYSGGDLPAGNHTLEVEVTDASVGTTDDELRFDIFTVYDDRFARNFDNSNDGSGGFLDGPELFAGQNIVTFETQTTFRNVDAASFDGTWNDVSNQQFVELSNDGGSTFQRVSNAQSGAVQFSQLNDSIDARVALSRFDDGTQATPLQGNSGQAVDVWQLFGSPDAVSADAINEVLTRAVVSPNTITGETIREAGLKGDATLLTRHVLAEFTVLTDQRLASAETTTFSGDND